MHERLTTVADSPERDRDRDEFNGARRSLFDRVPEIYRDGRPGYPEEVFSELRQRCGLAPGCRILEIGPGTGQATGPLLAAGAEVVAIELGPDLAAALVEAHNGDNLTVKVGPFEDLELDDDLRPNSFDLVVSATAYHWVPQPEGFQRCHDLLKPGGSLALWWNFFGDPERADPFHEAIQPLMAAKAPELLRGDSAAGGAHPYALDVTARTADFDRSGLFGPVTHSRFLWTGRHTSAQIRTMFASFSPWIAVEPEIREPLLDDLEALAEREFAGLVERPYITALYTSASAG